MDRRGADGAFGRLWAAGAVSNIGDGVMVAALPLLATTLTDDARLVALVPAAARLPWLVVALPAGVLVDRGDRRRLILAANAVRAVLVGLLAVLVAVDRIGIGLLLPIVFVVGVAETIADSSASALLPSLVPASGLERANARLYGTEVIANSFVGPPLGALLFTIAVAAPAALDALTFAVAFVLVASIGGRHVPVGTAGRPPPSVLGELGDGLRWLARHPRLRLLTAAMTLYNLAEAAVFAVLVLLLTGTLGVSPQAFGLVFAGGAIGGLLGTVVAPRIVAALGGTATMAGSMAVAGATYVGIGAAANAWIVAALLAVGWFVSTIVSVYVVSERQRATPDRLRGRITAAFRTCSFGAMPVGAALGGLSAETFGVRSVGVAGGSALLVGAVGVAVAGVRIDRTRAVEQHRGEGDE